MNLWHRFLAWRQWRRELKQKRRERRAKIYYINRPPHKSCERPKVQSL